MKKQHDLHIWRKANLVDWFNNTFQTNNTVVSCKFIILIFLKNSFLWGFSWKRYFICGRYFRRCWVKCWYCFQCFNQPKPFFVSTFLQKFAIKVFNAYYCWRRGLPIFPTDKLYPTIFDIFITWKWKQRDYILSLMIWTTSNNVKLINHDLIYCYPNSNLNYSPNPHK